MIWMRPTQENCVEVFWMLVSPCCHVEIGLSRLFTDEGRNVKIRLEFWKQISQQVKRSGLLVYISPIKKITKLKLLAQRLINSLSVFRIPPILSSFLLSLLLLLFLVLLLMRENLVKASFSIIPVQMEHGRYQ